MCVGTTTVVVAVEPDKDQIIVALAAQPGGDGWERIPTFDITVNKRLRWTWIAINYHRYKDSITVAFGDVVPDVLTPRCPFLPETFSLACFHLTPRRALRPQ
ncbi:DUF6334 family protein [Novosphingobium sp. BL-8A]|uniref:DUF6334 family protein n=1 Tax=Novosphingobium sp. BL-8A TaxID=3127639 RepID=UPI0037564363